MPEHNDDMAAELERLHAENERLRGARSQISIKVNDKGGVSVMA
jgi:hypothetical protein